MSGLSCIIMYTLYSLELCFTNWRKVFIFLTNHLSLRPCSQSLHSIRELLPIREEEQPICYGNEKVLVVSLRIVGNRRMMSKSKKNLCSIWHSKTKNKNVLFVDCHSALDPVRSYLIWISDAQNQSIIRWPWCQSCTQRTFHFLLQYPNRQQICLLWSYKTIS